MYGHLFVPVGLSFWYLTWDGSVASAVSQADLCRKGTVAMGGKNDEMTDE